MHINKSERKLLPMSRIAPGRNDAAEIHNEVFGSDHCPVELDIDL